MNSLSTGCLEGLSVNSLVGLPGLESVKSLATGYLKGSVGWSSGLQGSYTVLEVWPEVWNSRSAFFTLGNSIQRGFLSALLGGQ